MEVDLLDSSRRIVPFDLKSVNPFSTASTVCGEWLEAFGVPGFGFWNLVIYRLRTNGCRGEVRGGELFEFCVIWRIPLLGSMAFGFTADFRMKSEGKTVDYVIMGPLAEMGGFVYEGGMEITGEGGDEMNLSSLGWVLESFDDTDVFTALTAYVDGEDGQRELGAVELASNPAEKGIFTYFFLDEIGD